MWGFFQLSDKHSHSGTLASLDTKVAQFLASEATWLEDLVAAGEPVVNDALDKSSREVKEIFFPILLIAGFLLLGFLFADWKVLAVSALSIGSGLATTMGILDLLGERMNLVTTLIPALTFVLAMAMQVHVLVSIADHQDLQKGLWEKIKPNFLVSFTTSLGFGSLMSSHVLPISLMGKYMAMGIWIVFFWVHATHLGLSVVLKLKVKMPRLNVISRCLKSATYNKLIQKPIIIVVPLLVIALGAWVFLHNPTESNGLAYFKTNHPIRLKTAFLQHWVTGASDLELILPAPRTLEDAYMPDQQKLDAFEASLFKRASGSAPFKSQ